MCGILGIVSSSPLDRSRLSAMNETLEHRGPDDAGIWISEDQRQGLAHRRLSILDLSPLGRNPMHWDEGRLRITYNGEIYNFQELRHELEACGYKFKSNTDTEVVLAAYDRWGVHCLRRLIGMFAFGIWDSGRRRLFLARDRVGQKPLYYAEYSGRFTFASELKALLADPEFPRAIETDAICMYLRYGYVPAPFTAFRHARKLPPAHYALYEAGRFSSARYWDPVTIATSRQTDVDESEAIRTLEHLLRDSVRRQMISDVPIGAFLSGGIDSSLVVALMREQSAERVKTFTVRFENPEFNEADHSLAVAKSLGTEHYEETCGIEEMMGIVDLLPDYFDEPFADSSAIPTYLLSKLTRQHVTVALSGDGGDELFFGYERYHNYANSIALVESSRPMTGTPCTVAELMPDDRFQDATETELDKYAHWHTSWKISEIEAMMARAVPQSPAHYEMRRRLKRFSPAERAPMLDLVTYLPEDILTKVDRASMAASLEARAPFLDHRVVEFSLSLPLGLKWRREQSKWILRRILYDRVPRELLERPKMGFSVPLADWFRSGLREKITSAFHGPSLEDLGIKPEPARLLWSEFLAGQSVSPDLIWSLFTLSSWASRWA
jgi:asparagine synthase (glutamine-hydrolysing)